MRLFAAACALAAALASHSGRACSCKQAPSTSPEEAVRAAREQARAVFEGKVRRVIFDVGPRSVRVLFDVDKVWKGSLGPTAVVLTGRGAGDCGFPFTEGDRYLVYAQGEDEAHLGTSTCFRTRSVGRAEQDEKLLGAGSPPRPTPPPGSSGPPTPRR